MGQQEVEIVEILKANILEKLSELLESNLEITSNYYNNTEDVKSDWLECLKIIETINDNPENFKQLQKYFLRLKISYSEEVFINEILNIINLYEKNSYIKLSNDTKQEIENHPIFKTLIDRLQVYATLVIVKCDKQKLHKKNIYLLTKIITYLKKLPAGEYIQNIDEINECLYNFGCSLELKTMISLLIIEYNVEISKLKKSKVISFFGADFKESEDSKLIKK